MNGRPVTRLGGFIRDFVYDWKRHHIPPKQIAEANPLQFMLLDAAEQALREAGYHEREFDRAHTTTVVGTIFGGDFGNQLQLGLRLPELRKTLQEILIGFRMPAAQIDRAVAEFETLLLRLNPALVDETGSFTSSTLASRIAKTFNLMGGAMAVDAGETSSLAALSIACNLLQSHACSLAICAAAQRSMDRTIYECLALDRRLTGTTGLQPAGQNSDGFIPGEGVAVVLLKRLVEARADGDRILATIHGVQAASDPADLSRAVACAADRAWSAAGRERQEVSFTAAGCGVSRLDQAEQCGLSQAGVGSPIAPLPTNCLVKQIGYTRGAHGLVSLVKATLDFEQQASLWHAHHGNGHSRRNPLAAISNYATTG